VTTFSSMDIARTGVGFSHHWIDTIAHNMANANTITATDEEPFRALRSVAQPLTNGPFAPNGSGVTTARQVEDEGPPRLVHDPTHPLADEEGYVAAPAFDTGGMMVDLMIAQRNYQANVRTVQSAREAYESALRLGGR
jgi:flagellar basal-body rod protein FlgC